MRYLISFVFVLLFASILIYSDGAKALMFDGKEVPDKYIAQMDSVFKNCSREAVLSQYIDCRCLAVKFLETRLEVGDDIPTLNLTYKIRGQCPNSTALAGKAYEECKESLIASRVEDVEDFCSCVANTYVKEFERYPVINTRVGIYQSSKAYDKCGAYERTRDWKERRDKDK